ncbi:MAG: GDYXXLXY domain-containing protein [Candidatus Delongbacteria bacterium]|nr:GDYXXLXY domain-containing protein [Candidatus Delongbacteria bacterium]MBN2835396.1 GDYXXLXY domain-containing protein [Candidatus Delongbacteria bacterium]
MRNRKLLLIVLIIVQLAVPVYMIAKYEHILNEGKSYFFKIAPVDPYDPFRGKYLTIRVLEESITVDNSKDYHSGELVYLELDTSEKFAKIKNVYKFEPEGSKDYIKASVRYVSISKLYFKFTFDRYFMEESKAPKAEKIYFDALRDTLKNSYIEVNSKDGDAIIKELYISEKPIKEYFK